MTTGRRIWPVALLALITAVTAALALNLWRARARTQMVTTVVRSTAPAAAVHSGDCPLDINCFTGGADPTVLDAVRRRFPHATAVDDWRVINGINGSTVRDSVRVRTSDGVLVTVTSRCVRAGGPVTDRHIAAGVVRGPARVFAVAGGEPGCSAAVVLDVPAGRSISGTAAEDLAHDGALQLRD